MNITIDFFNHTKYYQTILSSKMVKRVGKIERNGDTVTGYYPGAGITEANLIRRSMAHIETYAPYIIIFDNNTSVLSDEALVHRISMCPIVKNLVPKVGTEKSTLTQKDVPGVKGLLRIKGPCKVTTDDIKGIPWAGTFNICTLQIDQEIVLEVVLGIGTGYKHDKWSPVATVFMNEYEGGMTISYGDLGKMDPSDVFREAEDAVGTVEEVSTNKFFIM